MRAKTTECLEFRKEQCLPPVRGWLNGKFLMPRGHANSNSANQQMPRTETMHLGENTSVPYNDVSVEQVASEKTKRGRDTQFWRTKSATVTERADLATVLQPRYPFLPPAQHRERMRNSWRALHWKGYREKKVHFSRTRCVFVVVVVNSLE